MWKTQEEIIYSVFYFRTINAIIVFSLAYSVKIIIRLLPNKWVQERLFKYLYNINFGFKDPIQSPHISFIIHLSIQNYQQQKNYVTSDI